MIKNGSMNLERMRNVVGTDWNMVPLVHAVAILLVCAIAQVQGEVTILTESGSHIDDLQSKQGLDFQLFCRSSDGAQIDWFHNSTLVLTDQRHLLKTSLQNGVLANSLTVIEARFEDSGFYVCQGRNEHFESDEVTVGVVPDDLEGNDKDDVLGILILHPSTFDAIHRVLSVGENGDFTLKCNASRSSDLLWYHNGTALSHKPPQVLITPALDFITYHQVSLLSMNTVGQREAGVYECRDREREDRGRAGVTVRVRRREKAPVEILEPPSKSDRILIGSSIEIKCKASNNSHLVWFFNGSRRLTDRRDSVQIRSSIDPLAQAMISILRLENATLRDGGRYSCRDERDAGDSDTVTITVYDGDAGTVTENDTPPMVVTFVTLRIGSVTNLQCSFRAIGDYRQEWTKEGRLLQTGDKYIIQLAKPSSLSIRLTERSDAGLYKCTFRYTSDNRTAGVIVFNATTIPCPAIDTPANGHLVQCPALPVFGESCIFGCDHGYILSNNTPIVCEREEAGEIYWSSPIPKCTALSSDKTETEDVPTTLSNVLLRIGSNLTLQCHGSLVLWSKQRHIIENGTKYTVDNDSLTIRDIERSDAGLYECSLYKGQLLIGKNVFNVTSLACPKPPLLPHGAVEACSDQPVFGEQCVHRCDTGFTLHGSRVRSCELAGDESVPYWTGDRAECQGSAEPWISSGTSGAAKRNNIPTKLCILCCVGVWTVMTVATFGQLLLPQSFRFGDIG